MTDTQALTLPPPSPSLPSQLAGSLTVQVLGSIVIHVLITLMIILFRTVLFALASPGPPDLLDEAKEAIHACPPRAVPLTQAQTAALSQRVCVKVCVLFHKEHGSERSQKERKSETEAERERRRGRELQGGESDESQSAGEDGSNISLLRCAALFLRKPCVEESSAIQLNGSLCMRAHTCR